jgi:hypothetical protein
LLTKFIAFSLPVNATIVDGIVVMIDAKITGITLAALIFNGK